MDPIGKMLWGLAGVKVDDAPQFALKTVVSPTEVRMDTLKAGDRFRCCQGMVWTYERRDGASSGVHHVIREDDGFKEIFAGCATVQLLSK